MLGGMKEKKNRPSSLLNRCGRRSSGSRMTRARSVDRLMVPKLVVSEWFSAAATTSREDGVGCAFRWKYHCETVAPVVPRCTPEGGGGGRGGGGARGAP